MIKNLPANTGDTRDVGLIPESGRSFGVGNGKWKPTPVFLTGKFHRQRSMVGYSPWGCKESDMTEYTPTDTHTYTSFSHSILKPVEGRRRSPWVIRSWERNSLPKKFQK